MSEAQTSQSAGLGWTGFILGAAALLAALVVFWAGPFAPQQSAGVTIGELAGEIAKSAMRSATGAEQPAPTAPVRNIDDYLQIAVAVLGGLAICVAAAGLVRHERARPAIAGVVLGSSAILFQFFAWAVMAVLGVLVIMSIINSMSGVFEGIFGG